MPDIILFQYAGYPQLGCQSSAIFNFYYYFCHSLRASLSLQQFAPHLQFLGQQWIWIDAPIFLTNSSQNAWSNSSRLPTTLFQPSLLFAVVSIPSISHNTQRNLALPNYLRHNRNSNILSRSFFANLFFLFFAFIFHIISIYYSTHEFTG